MDQLRRQKYFKQLRATAVSAFMNRTSLCASLLALTLFSTILSAQENQPSNIEVSTGSASSTPQTKKQRVISGDLSKALSAGIKYNPPPPPKPEAEQVDMREVDKPRNQIIRLPKYLVEAQRPPVFNDRNLYSKEMLRRLAYQRYISSFGRNVLNKYRLPIIGGGIDAYAMMQYEAEERNNNLAEMADKVSMYRVSGDSTEADQLKADAQNTFMRRSEYSEIPNAGRNVGK
jgi:hypothetical protein